MELISNELLSKVLGKEVSIWDKDYIKDNIMEVGIHLPSGGILYKEYNIYELAHKYKQWAYSYNYVIDCFTKYIEIRKQNEQDILHIEQGDLLDNTSHDIFLVFKACKWIEQEIKSKGQ